ncbi:MAG: hypothetical protein L3J09_05390 [Flavobacteriaceae bacterium]|nr:hypothetical protein [Flavobacteriaceae bacterium]
MKKLLILFSATLLLFSCSTDELIVEEINETANLAYNDNSNFGKYKGVFTTNDGLQRATVEIFLSRNEKSTAVLSFPNGKSILFTAKTISANLVNLDNIYFSAKRGSFLVSVSDNGKDAIITNVFLNNKNGDIFIIKETSRGPITPITGTYICSNCANTTAKTFNIVVSGDGSGVQTLATQTVFDSTTYTGIGIQGNCFVPSGSTLTVCETLSGDGITTATGFTMGAYPVEWIGEMIYSNIAPDCSEITGSWVYRKGLPNEVSGTFRSDAITNCLTELVFEDFEDTTVTYTTSIAEFTNGLEDYFTRTDGSNISSSVEFTNKVGTGFFAAQDVDGGGATLPVYLTFENLDIASIGTIFFAGLFAEDDDGGNQDWDSPDNLIAEFSFNANDPIPTWTPFFAIESQGGTGTSNAPPLIDTNLDGIGDGTEITDAFAPFMAVFPNSSITNPTASQMVSIRIGIRLNSGDEDIAFDNILIRGE